MSYDLGLNHEAEDDKYIKNAIQELESTYHLVLLTDYFEESLILLKVNLIIDLEGYIDVGGRCWWPMLESKCIGDNFEMLVTDSRFWWPICQI